MPFDDLAVDRDFFARPHAQAIADRDAVEVDVLVASVRANPARGLGREVQKRADRAARPLTRTQLEHLSEQDEHGDDRRRLEIDPDRAVAASKGRREQTGRQRRDDAVAPGDAGPHRDQREHVEVAADDRSRRADEERPTRP